MKDIEELLNLARTCVELNGRDLFNVTLISSLEDYVRYKQKQDEKEQVLQKMRDEIKELERVNGSTSIVCEPFLSYGKRLSLNDIVEYAEELESNDDVKTIQIMLYKLLAKDCSDDELQLIGNIKPKRSPEMVNYFHDKSQYVRTIKEQVNNHGGDNNV